MTGFSISAGGGFNAMVAARRMGLHVAYGGTPGTGPFADITRAALKEAGIPILRPRLAGHDQGVCTVLVEPSGERSFIASEGADGIVSDEDLDGLPLRQGDWLLLSGYTLAYRRSRAALTRWLQAQTRQRRLVFDPAPLVGHLQPETLQAALAAALWVTANGAEAAIITGQADPPLRPRRWPPAAPAAARSSASAPAAAGSPPPASPPATSPATPPPRWTPTAPATPISAPSSPCWPRANRPTGPPPSPTSLPRFPQKQKGRPRPRTLQPSCG